MLDLLSEILDLSDRDYTALVEDVPQFGGADCEVVVQQQGEVVRRYRLTQAVTQEFEGESLAERREGPSPLHTVLITGVVLPEDNPCTTSSPAP